ncbi:hypothetical protein Droror1_Dr00028239, partial [Drosera rotundifolia]
MQPISGLGIENLVSFPSLMRVQDRSSRINFHFIDLMLRLFRSLCVSFDVVVFHLVFFGS